MTAPERIWAWTSGQAAGIFDTSFHDNAGSAIEYVRADLATVPAQVKVKPLVWGWSESLQGWRADCELTRDVFCAYETNAGWVASSQTTGSTIHANADAAKSALDGYRAARILAALEPQPDPRDEVIARLTQRLETAHNAVRSIERDEETARGMLSERDKAIKGLVEAAQWARNRLEIVADNHWKGDGRDLKRSIVGIFADFDAALAAAKAVQHG